MAETKYNFNLGFPGFLSSLTLLFVAAKLFNFITWSWWIVLLPTILSFGLVFVVLIVILLIAIIGAWVD